MSEKKGAMQTVIDLAADAASKAAMRLDGWRNALTGLGDPLRDNMMAGHFADARKLSDEELEAIYHGEDLAAIICDALPEDGMRRGFEVEVKEGEDDEADDGVQSELKRLDAKRAITEAAIWGRVYGGAVVVMGLDDGQRSMMPLAEDRLREVKHLTVLDKRALYPVSWYSNPDEDGPKYGWPSLFRIANFTIIAPGTAAAEGVPGNRGAAAPLDMLIHESRVLRFDGSRTTLRRRLRNQGWADSVIQRVYDVLRQHNVGWQGTAHLLQEASQGVFKIEGLIDMIAGGDKEILQTRMQLVDMSRSLARSLLVDAEKEDFTRVPYSFAGVPDVLDRFMQRLAAAARMPVTKLFGRSPAGMNATGESDVRLWYDAVQSWQVDELQPQLERLVHLVTIASASPVKLKPGSWKICFAPLWQPTEKEKLEADKLRADRDKIYVDAQVALPEEIALAPDFPLRGSVDLTARREMLDAEIKLAKDQAGQPPPDPTALPPGGPQAVDKPAAKVPPNGGRPPSAG